MTAERAYAVPRVSPRPVHWTTDEWETPPAIVDGLALEFGEFDLDVCANAQNAKAPRYFTRADDGLQQAWSGRVWMNPPYSNPGPWVRKALEETTAGRCDLVVALLPAATDTGWFHQWVLDRCELRFRRGRIKFLSWDRVPVGTPKQGSIIAIYRRV